MHVIERAAWLYISKTHRMYRYVLSIHTCMKEFENPMTPEQIAEDYEERKKRGRD